MASKIINFMLYYCAFISYLVVLLKVKEGKERKVTVTLPYEWKVNTFFTILFSLKLSVILEFPIQSLNYEKCFRLFG